MSNSLPRASGSPAEWLRYARSDLAAAQGLQTDPKVLPNQVVFHAQQAAEKAIKGAMLQRRIPFPKTHDLKELATIWTGAGQVWPAELEDAKTLSPYALETRYPGYLQKVTRGDARAAIETAKKVVAWAEAILSPSPAASARRSRQAARMRKPIAKR